MSEMTYDPDQKAVMDALLLAVPGVKGGKAFGYPAYRIHNKIFAFVGGRGVAIKLPEAQVKALVAQGDPMHPFSPAEGIIWREWLSIQRAVPADYAQDLPLFEESLQFVIV